MAAVSTLATLGIGGALILTLFEHYADNKIQITEPPPPRPDREDSRE